MHDTKVAVPLSVLVAAWRALVPTYEHPIRACNGGPDGNGPWCFTCEAFFALQPYQRLWLGQRELEDHELPFAPSGSICGCTGYGDPMVGF